MATKQLPASEALLKTLQVQSKLSDHQIPEIQELINEHIEAGKRQFLVDEPSDTTIAHFRNLGYSVMPVNTEQGVKKKVTVAW